MTDPAVRRRVALPVDQVLPEVMAALRSRSVAVLEAPPGSGKTTRVPIAILLEGLAGDGDVIVVQPRRLAARMAARRVADELGQEPGGLVGWKVRWEQVGGPSTRLWYVTEGVLVRRLLADPELRGVGAVVLDEFHERSLDADLALALVRRLRGGPRPDLKLVVMSATLDSKGLAATLDAVSILASGRVFDVGIEYLQRPDKRLLEDRVAEAVDRLAAAGAGDILVFLPGAAEIRRARDACADLVRRLDREILPLHGDLPADQQDRAVRPGLRPKVILSTNVAETSITVEGVAAVVDSGIARRLVHNQWSGLPSLDVVPVSQASATQRAGRAGRTGPGRCIRLYTLSDYQRRLAFNPPEIVDADLAGAILLLRAAGLDPRKDIDWLDPPPEAASQAARVLLERLGLAGADGQVTMLGRQVARLPVHPRLGRLIAEAALRGCLIDGCLLAAVLSERDLRSDTGNRRQLRNDALPVGVMKSVESSLPAGFLDPVEVVELLRPGGRTVSPAGVDPVAASAIRMAAKHLVGAARSAGLEDAEVPLGDKARTLTLALVAAFPDRVGRVRRSASVGAARSGSLELAMCTGGTVDLPMSALLPQDRLVVVADASEREGGRTSVMQVRCARELDEETLMEGRLDDFRETVDVRFLPGADRVDSVRRLSYERLILDVRPFDPGPEILASALAAGLADLAFAELGAPGEDVAGFLGRIAYLRARRPNLGLPAFDAVELDSVRLEACRGCRSLADVRRRGVLELLSARLGTSGRRALDDLAPASFRLPAGRTLRIEYSEGQAPFAASRLQDFFGMTSGPSVLGGLESVTLHLRAPGGRDVQVTTDLAGFWRNHYPVLARELRRRYPRHSWPDDPFRASPPPPGRTR